jgi:hypothetical protein
MMLLWYRRERRPEPASQRVYYSANERIQNPGADEGYMR